MLLSVLTFFFFVWFAEFLDFCAHGSPRAPPKAQLAGEQFWDEGVRFL